MGPPCRRMISWQTANPRPVPLNFLVNSGSEIFPMFLSLIPSPVSVKFISTWLLPFLAGMVNLGGPHQLAKIEATLSEGPVVTA
jgi:hypothetical protein